jgi:hypothetical protein
MKGLAYGTFVEHSITAKSRSLSLIKSRHLHLGVAEFCRQGAQSGDYITAHSIIYAQASAINIAVLSVNTFLTVGSCTGILRDDYHFASASSAIIAITFSCALR